MINQNDVVNIHGSHLVSTAIYLNKDETILHVDVGDPLAWKVVPSKDTPYVLFIEPQLPQSDTNMTLITNEHPYQFHLVTNNGDNSQSNDVTYAVQFKYVDNEKQKLSHDLNQLKYSADTKVDPAHANYHYTYSGAKRIAPIEAFDNGTFTYFKFDKHTAIPAIFAVDEHRNEAIVNYRVEDDFVIVQGIHREYSLRNGEDVTSVFNDCFVV